MRVVEVVQDPKRRGALLVTIEGWSPFDAQREWYARNEPDQPQRADQEMAPWPLHIYIERTPGAPGAWCVADANADPLDWTYVEERRVGEKQSGFWASLAGDTRPKQLVFRVREGDPDEGFDSALVFGDRVQAERVRDALEDHAGDRYKIVAAARIEW